MLCFWGAKYTVGTYMKMYTTRCIMSWKALLLLLLLTSISISISKLIFFVLLLLLLLSFTQLGARGQTC